MCGFAGFIESRAGRSEEALRESVGHMANTLQHRGPDDEGVWTDAAAGIALGHRRLSILDLSADGRQPMVSTSGRYVIAYNGEIYNFRELRRELERGGLAFRGHSDTEVLLTAIDRWGLEAAVRRCVGMFAFAVWDRASRELILCRDRVGEKPLYYGWSNGVFLFGSELKPLERHPDWRGVIDEGALTLFLRFSYIPTPYSIWEGIRKLPPGTTVRIRPGYPDHLPEPESYWPSREIAEEGARRPFEGSLDAAADKLEGLLLEAVRGQMIADVPVGAFLSGGMDSSAVVALMQTQATRPVRTFCLGFDDAHYDEARYARAVARHLGTDHTEHYVTPEEALEVIPLLPDLYDEPFADSSQIPTYLISRLARGSVTVSLSGDGGDELFGGYGRYARGEQIWSRVGGLPRWIRSASARTISAVPTSFWTWGGHGAGGLLPNHLRLRDRVQAAVRLLSDGKRELLYQRLVSTWDDPSVLRPGRTEPLSTVKDPSQWPAIDDFAQWMMYLDLTTYLRDDILVKVDRAAMGVSLETRMPFLDHRVIEYAWTLPKSMKLHAEGGKRILRQVLYRYVPAELVDRPKMGFALPVDHWLRGPLREWAEELIDEDRLRQEGHFEPGPIRQAWASHLEGSSNAQGKLWTVLMFQAWLSHCKDGRSAALTDAGGRS